MDVPRGTFFGMTRRRPTDDEITQELPTPGADDGAHALSRKPYLVAIAGLELGAIWELGPPQVIGRGETAHISVSGASVSRRHAEIWVDAEGVWIRDLGSNNGTVVNGRRVESALLRDGDRIEIGASTILRLSYHDEVEAAFHARLRDSAIRDALTGLHNRRAFEDRIPGEIAYARRHRTPLALLLFDIDHFKSINDAHGHQAGDAVLVAVARLAQRTLRTEDLIVRYGGEEFLVTCRNLDRTGACALAERLRRAVESLSVPHGKNRLRVTISVGVAVGVSDAAPDASTLIALADQALYEAKRAGRNRVRAAP
jgi:diguanylate cyclase (GGDEF)-like protein